MVVELFLDTPDIEEYKKHKDIISGGTTNPSLMSRMGIPPEEYKTHCKKILDVLKTGVLSVEVTEVIPSKMYEEAKQFMQWGEKGIIIKIPVPFYLSEDIVTRVTGEINLDKLKNSVANSELNIGIHVKESQIEKESKKFLYVDTLPLIERLAYEGVPLNITCGFGFEQARDVAATIAKAKERNPHYTAKHNYFSIFWGRLLDSYIGNSELKLSNEYHAEDLEKILELSLKEVEECMRQLEGSGIRIILGSARLPKIWEKNAIDKDKEYREKHNTKVGPHLIPLQREAYRSMLKIAQRTNAIPTVFPGILDSARYNDSTASALDMFVRDFLKLKESQK